MSRPDPEHVVAGVLPGGDRSENKRLALAGTIVRALEEAGYLAYDIATVDVVGARVPIETVEAYGLTIRLDASGNAVSIASPYGLEIAE